ncbi:MAG: hypothetical protein Q4F57_02505 [Weeksellaceae bacterium]|nr:hypothetical protein [Weeksellaceae bacterium]
MITRSEVVIRIVVMLAAMFFATLGDDGVKQYISLLGLFAAFYTSLWLHRHFFPFVVGATLCYLLASIQEFWSAEYAYLPITKLLWTAGHTLLPIGFLDFLYRLIFKYEVHDRPAK